MIPLTKCPGCQGPFKRIKLNEGWPQEMCEKRCPLGYYQFHQRNFEDNEIGYFIFNTKDFNIYVYVDHFGYQDKIFIYHLTFPKGELTQPPFLIIPRFEI